MNPFFCQVSTTPRFTGVTPVNNKEQLKDFSGADLRNIAFFDVKLPGANFQNADLEGATFDFSSFSGANFRNANMQRTSFNTSSFFNADFSGADFTNARIFVSGFKGAKLKKQQLEKIASATAITMPDGSEYSKTRFS